ncbi:MAG: (2Fe-2S)-binding protein [Acetobacteraceae bacterium]
MWLTTVARQETRRRDEIGASGWIEAVAADWVMQEQSYGVANKSHLHNPPRPLNGDGRAWVPPERGPAAVYICLCNALTDRQVKQAAAAAGTTKSSEVYAACGCRAQCGQCARSLVALLRGDVGSIMEASSPT